MFAIIKTGGKQYKVQKGDFLKIEKLDGEVGADLKFEEVLLVADGETIQVGAPFLEGALVGANITEQGRSKKVIIFKYKAKKRYKKKNGHRQDFTKVQIGDITV